jgi:hypothetical protein
MVDECGGISEKFNEQKESAESHTQGSVNNESGCAVAAFADFFDEKKDGEQRNDGIENGFHRS